MKFNTLSMFVGGGVTGLGLKLYSIFPINETLLIMLMGISIWGMAIYVHFDNKKTDKRTINKSALQSFVNVIKQ